MIRQIFLRLLIVVSLSTILPVSSTLGMVSDSTTGKTHRVPAWAKHAVWYQIFPERFRNGDPSNDPKVSDIVGSWPHEIPDGWKISPWTGDWYGQADWEKGDSKGFYYHVQQRRYGGDLQGVIDKLDYLADLGVNGIYFTPLFQSPSLHKYDASMYHHIDKNFGPDPAGDEQVVSKEIPSDPATWRWTSADKLFLKLIREAHRRGIRVVIDGVFNHVGVTFWAFQDVRKKQQASQFVKWFTVKQWDDPRTPQDEFDYEAWYGVRELPELRKDEPAVKEHIKAIVRRWMDPNGNGDVSAGVDGWRLDAADKVPHRFWREFRTWVKGTNPDAYLVGEVWWEDWGKDKMFDPAPWLQGDVFDAVMNYRWAREVFHYFSDRTLKTSASEFLRRLEDLRREESPDVTFAQMNVLDSHDTDRLPSHILHPDLLYDHNAGPKDNGAYDIRKPGSADIRTQKLMVFFQMTFMGAPMVYYGDEAGMWGGDDPDCRKPMLWSDLSYDDERGHPLGKSRPPDKNAFDAELFRYYKSVIALRSNHEALTEGNFSQLRADDKKDAFAFVRATASETLVVVVNNSRTATDFDIPLDGSLASTSWRPLMGGAELSQKDETLHLHLQPQSGNILAGSKP